MGNHVMDCGGRQYLFLARRELRLGMGSRGSPASQGDVMRPRWVRYHELMPEVMPHAGSAGLKQLHPFQTDDPRLRPITTRLWRRSVCLPKTRSRCMPRATFWPSAGWPITFASGCMATRRISTSTGTSTIRTSALRPAGCAPSAARRTRPAPTPWRCRKPGTPRRRLHRGGHRVSHRRRTACRSAVPVLSRPASPG